MPEHDAACIVFIQLSGQAQRGGGSEATKGERRPELFLGDFSSSCLVCFVFLVTGLGEGLPAAYSSASM